MIKTLTEMAEFIAARDDLAKDHWQIFDLSAAKPMIDEMAAQYLSAGEIVLSTRLPAQRTVFFDGDFFVMAMSDGDAVCGILAAELLEAEMQGRLRGSQKAFIDTFDGDDHAWSILCKSKGESEARQMMDEAKDNLKREFSVEKYYEHGTIDEPATAPIIQHIAVMSEFCAFPIAQVSEVALPRPGRRRLKRMGVDLTVKSVGLSPVSKKRGAPQSPGDRKALHFCRGHWRKNDASAKRKWVSGAWRVWIDGHWKGDPSKGVVLHNYICSLEDAQQRSSLVV